VVEKRKGEAPTSGPIGEAVYYLSLAYKESAGVLRTALRKPRRVKQQHVNT
jgi:hypothetical protein